MVRHTTAASNLFLDLLEDAEADCASPEDGASAAPGGTANEEPAGLGSASSSAAVPGNPQDGPAAPTVQLSSLGQVRTADMAGLQLFAREYKRNRPLGPIYEADYDVFAEVSRCDLCIYSNLQ
jgi:hypothetical protein